MEVTSDELMSNDPFSVSGSSLLDHDYCNNDSVTNEIFANEEIIDVGTNANEICDMPVLQPNLQDAMDSLKPDSCNKMLRKKIAIKENRTLHLKTRNQKKAKRRRALDHITDSPTQRRECNTAILRSSLLNKTVPNIPIQPVDSETSKRYNLRSSRCINFKEEDFLGEDLLVLKKQVVVKARSTRQKKPLLNNVDALPPILQNQHTIDSISNGYHSNGYTFEKLNFDSYVLIDKSRVAEQEIQIKAEVLSDSDDDFVEETPGVFNETEQTNDIGDGRDNLNLSL